MPQREHSAILSTFIKLSFVIKAFVLSIFEWPFYKGFTVLLQIVKTQLKCRIMRQFTRVYTVCKGKKMGKLYPDTLDIYNGPFQRYYVNPITNIQEFINFLRLKFIVSIQKHEFIHLQRTEVYCINPEIRIH